MAHAYTAARWRKIIDISTETLRKEATENLEGVRRYSSVLADWNTLRVYTEKWTAIYDSAIRKAKEKAILTKRDEIVARNPNADINSLFPKWALKKKVVSEYRRLFPKPEKNIETVNQLTEELITKKKEKAVASYRYFDDFYRFQKLEKEKDRVREKRDLEKQAKFQAGPKATVQIQDKPILTGRNKDLVQKMVDQGPGDGAERDEEIKSSEFISSAEAAAQDAAQGEGDESKTSSSPRKWADWGSFGRPTLTVLGHEFPIPRTRHEFKEIWPHVRRETELVCRENFKKIREEHKKTGLPMWQDPLEFDNILPGKRGRKYLKRPQRVRRRQRARYVIQDPQRDRMVLREKYGTIYHGLFGETDNPWKKYPGYDKYKLTEYSAPFDRKPNEIS
uniref:Uncharacterized protein n=1 Tax=Amorphochlora amoebiformis TaxID=1561963 RepID=A0A7S0DSQ9_9EUKA